MSTRRNLLKGIAATWLCAVSSRVFAQAPKRISILSAGTRASTRYLYSEFEAGLRDLGYQDGKNIAVDYRFAENNFKRLPELAKEILRHRPDVVLAQSTPTAVVAKSVITETPVVFVGVADPLGSGLVTNLARPDANITGITNISGELAGKRLEILKELLPRLSRVAVIINPEDPNAKKQMSNLEEAARTLRIQLSPLLSLRDKEGLSQIFVEAAKSRTEAAIRMVDPLNTSLRKDFVSLAAKHKLPVIYPWKEDAEAGGLIAYGTNLPSQFRRAAAFVDKILKGTHPRDLPVEQPTDFELVINRKSANALGLTIPQSLYISAAKVID